MSDAQTPAGAPSGAAAEHPVDAVLAALRAVPDAVLRDVEPATIFLPEPTPTAGAAACAERARS